MKKTPLHAAHITQKAKMGEFAGYDMPLYYDLGVKEEHLWTRSKAGIFDVSHMGQAIISGAKAANYFEKITPSSFNTAPLGLARYTVLTNETGGIIDDLIITKLAEDKFFVVFNAGCKEKDIDWMRKNLDDGLNFELLSERALIALQGPKAETVLKEILKIDASELGYMRIMADAVLPCGNSVYISRLGYTGEDGFELSIPQDRAEPVWNAFLENENVKPIGLAARDSLRLDMGYPLYGHDIDDTTSPIEADLSWVVQKNNPGHFFGAERILKEKQDMTIARKRVGIKLIDKGVAREGVEIFAASDKGNKDAAPIGHLTSGGYSPSLEASVGQGYVAMAHAALGTSVCVRVRGRDLMAEVTAMPFIEAKTKAVKKAKAAA